MRRTVSIALAALALLATGGCNGLGKIDYTSLGRDAWQRPDDVVDALALAPGERVADLGAGEGYFVHHLSEAVGANGRVFAVEVERDLSEALRERFPAEESNVIVILGGYADPQLPEASVDVVLIVNTYHHIEERSDYFARLRSDLRPNARVIVIEPDAELGGILGFFVEDGHESRADEVRAEMHAAGYDHAESLDILPVQIFEVFTPAAEAS